MTKILVVGLGMGNVYINEFKRRGWDFVTVDVNPDKNANFRSIEEVPVNCDLALVATPNWTHKDLAEQAAKKARVVAIEKPGLESAAEWRKFVKKHPDNRILMVKNNCYRVQNKFWANLPTVHNEIERVNLLWITKDRVSGPGSWFTTKKLAWAGVSRDLMPHMLNVAQTLFNGQMGDMVEWGKFQRWTLADIEDSSWGTVKKDGVYDVDDHAWIVFKHAAGFRIKCMAVWKTDQLDHDLMQWQIGFKDGTVIRYDAGLCPEPAYGNMIEHFINMRPHHYELQVEQDIETIRLIESIPDVSQTNHIFADIL
jgi:predicted dehydrogenase